MEKPKLPLRVDTYGHILSASGSMTIRERKWLARSGNYHELLRDALRNIIDLTNPQDDADMKAVDDADRLLSELAKEEQ